MLVHLQDGEEILPSERIAAQQRWDALHAQLREELRAEGIDPDEAAEVRPLAPVCCVTPRRLLAAVRVVGGGPAPPA